MNPRVLVVDDDLMIVRGIVRVLEMVEIDADGATSAAEANQLLDRRKYDAAILDIAMPGENGIALCRRIRSSDEISRLPVLYLTASDDNPTMELAFEAGGDDYLIKPFRVRELIARVRAAAQRYRLVRDLDDAESVLMSLARAVEAKDGVTADHCERLSRMATDLGRRLKLPEADIEALRKAGVLHDVGKISIPDAVLLKPGELTATERKVMETHASAGADLVHPLRTMSRTHPIVRHHHERLDGSGYPDGLSGENIPYLAKVFQVCDIFDALVSERPYKPAFSREDAFEILESEAQRGWRDPDIVISFITMISS